MLAHGEFKSLASETHDMIAVVNERHLQIKSLLLTTAESDLQIKIDSKMLLMLNTLLVFVSLRIKEFAKAVD